MARAGTEAAFTDGGDLVNATNEEIASCDADIELSTHTYLSTLGFYCYNAPEAPSPVGAREANAWDIHDVHGNVAELVHDGPRSDPEDDVAPTTDPVGPSGSAETAQVRGGSHGQPPVNQRLAALNATGYDDIGVGTGFRIVRSLVP